MSADASSSDRACPVCKAAIPEAARTCPSCGREMTPPKGNPGDLDIENVSLEDDISLEETELGALELYEAPGRDPAQDLVDQLAKFQEDAARGSADLKRVTAILEGIRPLREAADKGDEGAQRTLDESVAAAEKGVADFDEEFHRCRAAAEAGDVLSQRRFGEMLRTGAPVVMDEAALERWLADFRAWMEACKERIRLIREGSDGPRFCGDAPPMPRSVLPDPSGAWSWFLRAAAEGDAVAMRAVGEMFQNGEGVPRDAEQSERWFRLASERGDARAQLRYGVLIWSQHHDTPREEEAVRWLTAAAEQGETLAEYTLGLLYDHRRDRPELWALAVPWFRRAAEHGFAEAYFHLAEYHRWDEIMPRDDEEAVRLYRRAFEMDPAMLVTSGYLNWGWNEQDLAVSIAWFRKYAEQGESWAREIAEGLEKKVV